MTDILKQGFAATGETYGLVLSRARSEQPESINAASNGQLNHREHSSLVSYITLAVHCSPDSLSAQQHWSEPDGGKKYSPATRQR